MKSVSMTQAPLSPLMSRAQAYLDLTKPKIVFLLDFTALMAFLVATRGINLLSLAAIRAAGTLASAGAGALNCYLDRDIDQSMGRTSHRPIPRGEISPFNALGFGLLLVAARVGISLCYFHSGLACSSSSTPRSTLASTQRS